MHLSQDLLLVSQALSSLRYMRQVQLMLDLWKHYGGFGSVHGVLGGVPFEEELYLEVSRCILGVNLGGGVGCQVECRSCVLLGDVLLFQVDGF